VSFILHVLHNMAAASASASDAQTSYGIERDNEPRLDVELLKDTARKALIDTLNAVRPLVPVHLLQAN
jgi:hypothetical protein